MIRTTRINFMAKCAAAAAVAAAGLLLMAGCKHPGDDRPSQITPLPTSEPTVATPVAGHATPASVDFQDKGTHLQYPSTWKPKADKDFQLHLVCADGAGDRDILFDIPELPFHFPGMIRLGLIENGYVDDLKKQHPGLKVDSSEDRPMNDGARARLVQCSWKQGDQTRSDVGLLMMRKDQVYILSCDAAEKDLPATRKDFDKVAGTLHWD